ncbi:MAG: hemin receptor, partial [Bacteroidaceae bacterium]|nr:hemin receptor [Bacteroidaceae bacterium]
MKKFFTAALLLASLGAAAQETYQNAELADANLNGTARYVGMGGAMDALGADISAAG